MIPIILWIVGLGMALHPVAWVLLLMYREDWRDNLLQQQREQSYISHVIIQMLDMLAVWILDFTPKFTSFMLTLFLATSSLYIGIKCIKQQQN